MYAIFGSCVQCCALLLFRRFDPGDRSAVFLVRGNGLEVRCKIMVSFGRPTDRGPAWAQPSRGSGRRHWPAARCQAGGHRRGRTRCAGGGGHRCGGHRCAEVTDTGAPRRRGRTTVRADNGAPRWRTPVRRGDGHWRAEAARAGTAGGQRRGGHDGLLACLPTSGRRPAPFDPRRTPSLDWCDPGLLERPSADTLTRLPP